MNDLLKIASEAKELGLEYGGVKLVYGDYVLTLIDKRGPDWEVHFYINETGCNVVESNYECACEEQSNKTVPTFEEASSNGFRVVLVCQ